MTDDLKLPDAFRQYHPRLAQLVEDGILTATPPEAGGDCWTVELDGRPIFLVHKDYGGSLYLPLKDKRVPFHYLPEDLGNTPYFHEDYSDLLKGKPVATLFVLGRTDMGEQTTTPCFAIHVPDMDALSEDVRNHPEIAQDGYASKQVTHRTQSIGERIKELTVEGLGMGIAMLFSKIVPIPGVSSVLRVVARNAVSQSGDVREYHMDSYDYAVGFPVSELQLLEVLTMLDLWKREVTSVNNFSLFKGVTLDELVLSVFRVAGIGFAEELGFDHSALMQSLPMIAPAMYFGLDGLIKRAGAPVVDLTITPLEEGVQVYRVPAARSGAPIVVINASAVDGAEMFGLSMAPSSDGVALAEDETTRTLYASEQHALRVSLYLTLRALLANGITLTGGEILENGQPIPQGETRAVAHEATIIDYQQQAMLKAGAENMLGG